MAKDFGALSLCLCAALLSGSAVAEESAPARGAAGSSNWLTNWFATSDAAKESQPHWMTPLITVTPRLEQEFRWDQVRQDRPQGLTMDNYGNGKGLELIPLPDTEVILGVPAYEVRHTATGTTVGAADETFLLKYRLLSGNEENGSYIVTAFLGANVPTGSLTFTQGSATVTPTLAVGKGWGSRGAGFDVQSTLAYTLPVSNEAGIGQTLTWNTALQVHVLKVLWPEFEGSYTAFHDGPNAGKHQLAWTGGIILGRINLGQRARLIVGTGYQWTTGSFRSYLHSWLATARVAF